MENKTDSAVDNETEGFVVEEGIKRPVSKIDAIHILWDIAKKYEIALKHKKVVPIDVAERDRKQINELARKLIDINEKVIDARVLYDLVKMQRFRDKTIILEFMTHKDVLKRIANIVKRRGTPIVSLTGYSVKGASGLNKTSVLDIIEKKKDRQGFEEEELQSIKDLIESVKIVEIEKITTKDLDNIRRKINARLFGKCFKIKDLPALFSPTELSLLSQMIRDETIPSFLRDGNTICFKQLKTQANKNLNFVTVALNGRREKK